MEGLAAALRAALIPGTPVTRYNRVWRLTQWHEERAVCTGRIGFEARDAVSENWNAERQDFVRTHPLLGQTTTYAVNMNTMRVAFQLRGTDIRVQTFRGAFIAILRATSRYRWVLDLEGVAQDSWEDWVAKVERIVKLDFQLVRPNPRFNKRVLQDLFSDTKSAAVEIILEDPEGFDVESSEFIMAALDHVERGYGTYEAKGILVEDGVEVSDTWKQSTESEVLTETVTKDPETGEAPPSEMRHVVTVDLQTDDEAGQPE